MVLIFSNAQLSELFEHSGAALLDFAERAENNTIQGRFFEAMGLIQNRRPEIEHRFREQINLGFKDFGSITPPTGERDSDSELSLVEPDEMEESVACENLIIRANANYFPDLFALSQRFAALRGGRKLKDYEIPAGPHHLVHSFRRAIHGLEVDVRIKVILYALFDKFVVRQAKSLYDKLNGTLKAAGVLPNLKPIHLRQGAAGPPPRPRPRPEPGEATRESSAQPDSVTSESREAPSSLGAELFDSILDLMSTRRSGRRQGSRQGPSTAVDPAESAAVSRDLVSALSQIQSRTSIQPLAPAAGGASGEIPNLEIDTAFMERVRETLSQEREQALASVDRSKLSPVDADLIDLIGMLFEYMLNDPVLPNLAKALLSHLHTPYLKVALIDRRLLVDARHPARRLLDQMVEAGSLWVDETNPHRGIFPSMQRVVDRVLQEFVDNVALFDELLEFFDQSMRDQQRRTDTMEQRTKDAARGREKLQLAKGRANHQIQRLLQEQALPQVVSTFLSRTWLDLLVFILLRDKEEDRGEAWREAVGTAEDLALLFDAQAPGPVRSARQREIPALQARIVEGVQRMGSYTRSTLDDLFNLLAAPETWPRQPVAAAQPAPAAVPAPTPAAAAATEGAAAQAVTEQEQEVVKRLRKMKPGTWFELRADAAAAPRRIKLSWLSPLTATCMFVDRSGMQAEIKTLHELAQEIISGNARVIPRPKHPFIERALVSIRKVLQGQSEAPRETETGARPMP
jgi:hypothetical protein